MMHNMRLRLWSAIVAGLVGATSALAGAVAQMMTEGKTDLSDVSELVWLFMVISFVLSASKDIQAFLKGVQNQ